MKLKSAYIEITNKCNLNCRDCYNSSGLNTHRTELEADVLMGFIRDTEERYNVNSVSISGGEPLLHTEINDILRALSRLCSEKDMTVNFITNGTVDNALFYELAERDPHFFVQVSLDGPNETANSSMRGEGNFERVMSNMRGRRFYNKPVYKMVINRKNAEYVSEYGRFVHDVLGGRPAFAFAVPYGNAAANWGEMELPVADRAKIVVKVRDMYREYGIKGLTIPLPTSICGLMPPEPVYTPCIKSGGSFQPCQNFYDDRYSVGNIHDIDWQDIERKISALSARLERRLSESAGGIYGCGKCMLHNKCGRGCPAIADVVCSDMPGSDGECEFRRQSTMRLIKNECKLCQN